MATKKKEKSEATEPESDGAETDVELVKMVREEGEPSEADVHPDEVANYKIGGWRVAE